MALNSSSPYWLFFNPDNQYITKPGDHSHQLRHTCRPTFDSLINTMKNKALKLLAVCVMCISLVYGLVKIIEFLNN